MSLAVDLGWLMASGDIHHSYDRKEKTRVVAHEGSEEVEYEPHDAARRPTGTHYSTSG